MLAPLDIHVAFHNIAIEVYAQEMLQHHPQGDEIQVDQVVDEIIQDQFHLANEI